MKAEVLVYDTKRDYALDEPSYGEEYYSISEAIADKKRVISMIKKTAVPGNRDFLGFRIFDTVGNLKWELPSESVPDWYVEQVKAEERAKKHPKMQEYREKIRTYQG